MKQSGSVRRARAAAPVARDTASLPPRTLLSTAIATACGLSPAAAFANTITPDGRTATEVTTGAGATDVTTGTVRGANAFNSFRDFRISAGNTVNLHLPDATDNLINLVTDSRAVIDGTLNSVREGRIGGNVVFADPKGIVVGASGVMNVGSLMLTTPTSAFMNRMMDSSGLIDDSAVSQLLAGDAPQSTALDATIELKGTVNAFGAVTLQGGGVALEGEIEAGTDAAHEKLYEASVNTDGIEAASDATVIDGRVTIRAAGDVTVTGTADASSAQAKTSGTATRESGGSAGRVEVTAGGDIDLADGSRLAAVGAADGGDGGRVDVRAAGNVTVAGEVDASGTQDTGAGGNGDGGEVTVTADQQLDVEATATVAAAGAASGGDGGRIELGADGTANVSGSATLDASAGATGDGGEIELDGAGDLSLAGLDADLAGGAGGTDGQLLISTVNVSVSGTEYYTNGGDVTINAGDTLTIATGTTINTRRIDDGNTAVEITPASDEPDNPSGLANPTDADDYTVASEGDSGNVLLQAPKIAVADGARIYTFATDGYDGGDVSLVSGDNFTCNICEARDPTDYFSSVEDLSNSFRVASTDDVSIDIANGATIDARYVERAGYDGSNGVGAGGDVALSADASDMQVAGWSMADASVTVNGALRGANVSMTATANAGVDFAWLAGLDPANPAGGLGALQEISTTEFDQIHQNAIENADDPSDLTNLLGIGLPVTAGIAMADAKIDVGAGAEIDAAENVSIEAVANRTVLGATGGIGSTLLPELGLGVIFGQVSGETSAAVSDDAAITASALDVVAESDNEMEVGASAQVAKEKRRTKGNSSVAFALAIGRADVDTSATVGRDVTLSAADADPLDVQVRSSNLDTFTTEGSTVALTARNAGSPGSQGAMTVAFSEWRTDSLARFDASLGAAQGLGDLDVVADNLSVARVTRSTVQTGANALDYLVGGRRDRRRALNALIGGTYGRSGSASSFRLSAGAAITLSEQTAIARVGGGADIDASGDVTVRSRVVDQGIRNIADSRVNSSAGKDASRISGSVAVAFGMYDHTSQAVIGDGVDITAARIGVGARAELPIDNDYDEALGDFDVTQWDGPRDFFGAVGTLAGAAAGPDPVAVESLGLSDYLLTSYANAYGTAEETAVFGSANALIASQDTRAWVGEGATLTATGADGEWTSEFGFAIEPDPGADPHDLDTETEWTWSAPVDVDARTRTETAGVTGNLSLLTLATSRQEPSGTSVGGSFAWTEFDNTTIAGIGDGAVVTAPSLDVTANTDEIMYVIAPSAGQGESTAGNGIFSLAQMDGTTHASIHSGARIDAGSVDVRADHGVNLWAIGGAVAVSSETSIGAAVAANDVVTDTRAYIGDNSADRVLDDGEDPDAPIADVAVATGEAAGLLTGALTVDANSEGRVGAIGVAGAVARGEPSTPSSPSAPPARPTPSTPTNNSFLGALQSAGDALGGGGSTPGGQSPTLSGAGSGTLNFSRINTVAEVRDTTLLNDAAAAAPNLTVRALTNVDQVSASGSAAVSIAGGGGGRSSAFAGAVAFNDIDNETRAGLYGFGALNGGRVGDVDVLAATSGDALSIGIALAATKGQSSVGAAGSVSIATVGSDTTAEIEDSQLTAAAAADSVAVTGYDRSRALAGGGALYLGLGGGSGAGVGLAATYGRVDNDVSAYVRGSTLADFATVDVEALGASRILAGAFGGSVSTGNSASGAGSLYIMTLEGNLAAGITGAYGTTDDDGDPATPEVTDYTDVQRRSNVDASGDVNVRAASSAGVGAIDGLFSADGGFDGQADFSGGALDGVDPDQTGVDPDGGVPGEAMLGFAGSLAISGGNAAAGMAIGFTDLQGSYVAEVRDADVTATAGDVNVKAVNSRQAIGVAAGASVSGGGGPFTLLGSGAITLSDTTVKAQVLGGSTITADHVDIAAAAEGTIYSVAGSVSASASGSAAIGAAASYNNIGGTVSATLGGDSVVTDGSDPAGEARTVDVTADQDADIRSVAVAASATGGNVAIGGSATINTITTNTTAALSANAVTADTVRVRARNGTLADRAGVWSLAGSVTASSTAGFGAAFAVNTLGGTYNASVDGTTFTDTEELTVHGTSASEVRTIAASGGGSGSVAAGVSNTTNTGTYEVGANLTDVELLSTNARVDVYAGDDSSIESLAGAAQFGGGTAVGAAIAGNSLDTTVDAGIHGGSLDVENVLLQSRSNNDIDTIAVGIAGSGTTSVSGSVAVNHVTSGTTATIDGGAAVVAANNVGVLAGSDDRVGIGAGSVAISGSVLGGAGSVTVNVLDGTTEAAIRGSGTRVEARGEDDSDTVTASGGELASTPSGNPFSALFGDGSGEVTAPSPSAFSGYSAPNLAASGNQETGVVVDAIALQQASNVVATAGVSADFVSGGTGVAGAINTTVLGGSASALVENATIGNASVRDDNGDLTVAAGHHAYGTNVMLGIGAGSAGGVGTISVDTLSGAATAALRNTDVYAGGAVDLDAVSRRDVLTVIAGLSVGTYGGVTGSGALSVFDGTTTAEIIGDGYMEADSVDLRADSETDQDLVLAGFAGSGGFAGTGGLAVAVSQSDTIARVGDGNDRPEVHTDGAVAVKAVNDTRLNTVTASAAYGSVGLAGAVGVQYIGNSTEASLDNAFVDAGSTLDVTAEDTITLDAVAGSGAVGGVAGGVGVNVGVIKSRTAAEAIDSDVRSDDAVTVEADRYVDLEVDTVVASASFGGGYALSGGVGVLLFGDSLQTAVGEDADGDLADELGDENGQGSQGDWLDKADAFRAEDHLATTDDEGNTVDRASGAADGIDKGGSGNFGGVRNAVYTTGDDGVGATVSGGTMHAGTYSRTVNAGTSEERDLLAGDRPVTVGATDHLKTRNEVVAVSIGGQISAGGGVAVTQVNTDVAASAVSDDLRASDLTIEAASRNGTDGAGNPVDALRTAGYSGAAGLVGIGAAVGVGTLNGSVGATLGGNVNVRDAVDVITTDTTTADVQALGASFGLAGAVGVAVAVADRDASVVSSVQSDSTVEVVGDDATTLEGVEVRADALGGARAKAEAAAGGLFFAGNGAVASSSDDRTVGATVGTDASIVSGGDISVLARTLPDVAAYAGGGSISYGGSVGASVASASANNALTAGIGDGAVLTLGRGNSAGTLSVRAEQHAPNSAGDWADSYDGAGIRAESLAVNGAVYLAANAATAHATDRGSVTGTVGDGVLVYHEADGGGALPGGSHVTVEALREAGLLATSSGIVGAALAVGASVADADSDAATDAYFGGSMGFQADTFSLDARSVTDVVTDATSGSGGIVAGAAADAFARDDADTTAEIGGASLVRGDKVDVFARHESRFRPAANSVQAAAVGFSGSFAEADIDNTVVTRIADAVDVANDVFPLLTGYEVAVASDSVVADGTRIAAAPERQYSVEGGAGGVLNGAAADSRLDLDKSSTVEIGDNAVLRARNEPGATEFSGLATLTVRAGGSVNVNDRAYLGAGGVIQAPYASSEIDLDGFTDVTIGDSARLMSEDLLGVSASEGSVDVSANGVTKTWGGVGFAGATTDNDTYYNQTVTIGDDSLLEGLGYTFVTAGRRADTGSTRAESVFRVEALSDTYNYTAAPLDTDIDAVAKLTTDASVTLGNGSEVIAGWDVALGALKGERTVIGKGTGHNPYLELLSTETTERNESTSGATSLTLDGDVIAGYFNQWSFDVADDGASVVTTLNGAALNAVRAAQDVDAYVDVVTGFNAQDYVAGLNEQVADLGETYQSIAEQVQSTDVPGSVNVVRIRDVTATQGNVVVYGDSLAGSGSVEARGGASISITNSSDAWLDVGNLNVVDNVGGNVLFAGAIETGNTGSVTVNEVNGDLSPAIAVVTSGNTGASLASEQPGLMVGGPLYNQRGMVRLYNRNGNIYQGSVIQASQIQVVAPNGAYVIIAPDATIHAGGTPWSVWDSAEFNIGASDVIAYALRDYIENSRGVTLVADDDPDVPGYEIENYLYEHWATGTYEYDPGGDAEPYDETYRTSFVPYNAYSIYGNYGDSARYPYAIFDNEYRQARFDSVPLKALSNSEGYGAIDASEVAAGGIYTNKVLILADVLDVNAPIVAGQESDVTIDFDATIHDRIVDWRDNDTGDRLDLTWYHESGYYQDLPDYYRDLLGLPPSSTSSGEGWYALAPGESIPFTADRTVSGYYDRASKEIVLDGVQGANTGFINVDAQIVSTTREGRLEVINGYSDITLNNTTDFNLVLNDISTGTAETGVIEITDRIRDVRTWYVQRVGESTQKYVTTDLTAASWLDDGVNRSYADLGTYRPEQGMRYWWERRYRAKREINGPEDTDGDFTYLDFRASATPWEFADGNWNTGTTGTFNGDITASGLCDSSCDYGGGSDFHQWVTDTEFRSYFDDGVNDVLGDSWTEAKRVNFTYGPSVDGFGSHRHDFRWPLRAEMSTRTSVRADYPIDIRFTGSSTGSIDVTSNANVTVAGRLESRGGDVTMDVNDGANLFADDNSLINAINARLDGEGGVGTRVDPMRVSLDGGYFSATSRHGAVNVTAPAGDLRIGLIAATGAARLSSDQSLLSILGVQADVIELRADGGRIEDEDGSAFQVASTSRVDAHALEDISIAQVQGDLYLGQVESLDGDVSVTAENGNILSGTNQALADLIPLAELRERWASLGITGESAGDDADIAIEAFESMVERQYRRYWQLSDALTTAADGSLAVTSEGQRLYAGIAAAAGKSVEAYVIEHYEEIRSDFLEREGVTDLSSVAGFDAFDEGYTYTASAAREVAFRNGASWDEKRLENAVNAAAVATGGAGVSWLSDDLNVSGRNVTLRASGDVGSFGTHTFELSTDTTITDQQRRWLLSAAPGGLFIEEAAGNPDAVDVDVRTLSRLRVEASENLDVIAGTDGTSRDAFIGASGDVSVERLDAGGEIYLGAQRSITYASGASPLTGATDGLTLRSIGGDILGGTGGSFDLAIDGTLTGAIAGGAVDIRDAGGAAGLDVGILYARDSLAVRVPGDLRQEQGRGFRIGARSLELDVGGNAGTVGDGTTGFAGPLNLRMRGLGDEPDPGLDGTVFGRAGGDLYLDADVAGLRLAGAATGPSARGLDVGGTLTLASAGDVWVDGPVSAGNGATLQSVTDLRFDGGSLDVDTADISLIGNTLDMSAGSRASAHAGRINAGVTGDARLGLLEGGPDTGSDVPAITVTAGGSILSARGAGEPNLRVTAPQGFDLDAGTDIGAADGALALAGSGALAATAGHDMYLRLLDDITGGTVTATSGRIDTVADGGVDLATARAELDQDWTVGGDFLADALTSTTGDAHVVAQGAIDVGVAEAAVDLTLDADGGLLMGRAEVGRDLLLDTGAGLMLEWLRAGRDITIESVGATTAGPIDAGRDLRVAAGYDEGAPTGAVSDIALHAASGASVDLRATGAIRIRDRAGYADPAGLLEAGTDATLTAGGDIEATTVLTGEQFSARAGGDFLADLLASDIADIRVLAEGAINVARAVAGVDVLLDAAAALAIGQGEAGRDLVLDTGAGLSLDGLIAGRDITTESVGDTSGGPIDAGRDLTVAAGYDEGEVAAISDILLHSVRGENVDLRATGAIRIRDRDGYADPAGLVEADATATFTAGGDIEAATVRSGGDTLATGGGRLSFETIDAGTDVALDAADDIVVFDVSSGGDQTLRAGGSIDFDRLDAGGSIDATSRGDTSGREAFAGGDATFVAGVERAAEQPLTAPILASSDLRVESVTGTAVWLRAGGENLIRTVGARTTAKFEGDAIDATVRDIDGGRLDMAFSAGDGGLADTVRLAVTSDGLVAFDPAYARDARIDTTSERIVIADGWISEWFSLDTPRAAIVMDQLDPTARNVDFQLRELDERFALRIDGDDMLTDAYIQHYRGGYANAVPNFVREHDSTRLDVRGESAERKITRAMGDKPEESVLGSAGTGPIPSTVPLGAPTDGTPVNLGTRRRSAAGDDAGI